MLCKGIGWLFVKVCWVVFVLEVVGDFVVLYDWIVVEVLLVVVMIYLEWVEVFC